MIWIKTLMVATGLMALLPVTSVAAAEKTFGLTSFDAVVLNADFAVEVTTGSPVGAVAVGSPTAFDRVSIEAEDGTLTIRQRQFAGDDRRTSGNDPVIIRIRAMPLREATVTGAGSLTIDQMRGATVQLGLRGPGRLIASKISADRVSAAMIGNGSMTLSGTVKKANFVASGAGVIDAGSMPATDLTVDSEGSGDHVFNAVRTAAITSRGVGTTVVRGSPACTVRNAGSGSVVCGQRKSGDQ